MVVMRSKLAASLIVWALRDCYAFSFVVSTGISSRLRSGIRSGSSLVEQEKLPDVSPCRKPAGDGIKRGALRILGMPKKVLGIYSSYASRLWRETNPEARRIIAKDKASVALRQLLQTMSCEQLADVSVDARNDLSRACQSVLLSIEQSQMTAKPRASEDGNAIAVDEKDGEKSLTKKKSRSVLFGALMGAAVALWVFAGNYVFTALFTLMTLLGQLEYYRMVMGTGVSPARRISVVGSCSMFLTALFTPSLHELCLPLFGLYTMIYFLTMKRSISTIPEIATTFTGMFYLGYVPSFWVRVRTLGTGMEPAVFGPLFNLLKGSCISAMLPQLAVLPATTGSIFLFWTWLSLAFSDVGAYFVGRRYGRTKLGKLAPAAGETSPNKTVEGVLGGCALSGLLSILGTTMRSEDFLAMIVNLIHILQVPGCNNGPCGRSRGLSTALHWGLSV